MKSTYNISLELVEKLRKLPSKIYAIRPYLPKYISSGLHKNNLGEMSIIYTFTVPTGYYIVINPLDKNHHIKFHPRTKDNMEIIDGEMEIWHVIPDRVSTEIYNGPTGDVIWRDGVICIPGEEIQLRFLHPKFELDEVNTILEMRVDIKSENM
jgi:hypothetical protein